MFASDKWETISEISERKHCKYQQAAEAVQAEFQAGIATCRFIDKEYGQMLEFRLNPRHLGRFEGA